MELTVLLVEEDAERGSRLEVLLRIAGYRTVSFASIDEAINWSSTCSNQGQFGLCLLHSVPGPVLELAAMLKQIRDCRVDLPVLLVNRALPELATRPEARRQLACIGVHICEPTEIVETLAKIFLQHRPHWLRVREGNSESMGVSA